MSAQVALDRLAPHDIYVRLDRLRAEWHGDVAALTDPDSSEARYADTRRQAALELHEKKIALQLVTLRRLLELLPPRFYDRAIIQFRELGAARLSDDRDWLGALSLLRRTVGEWDQSRPPLVACPECDLMVRGQRNLKTHRYIIHEIEDDA